ncbi:MAG: hypothetical protein MZU97_03520 [Bacillus subtilis]|nr:hypothetical protein [Bacillus subtilis]
MEKVALHFGKPNQINLSRMTVKEADQHIAAGHFAKGSMLPKVVAAKRFAASEAGRSPSSLPSKKPKKPSKARSGTIIKED